jgi:hypothetical protein
MCGAGTRVFPLGQNSSTLFYEFCLLQWRLHESFAALNLARHHLRDYSARVLARCRACC